MKEKKKALVSTSNLSDKRTTNTHVPRTRHMMQPVLYVFFRSFGYFWYMWLLVVYTSASLSVHIKIEQFCDVIQRNTCK